MIIEPIALSSAGPSEQRAPTIGDLSDALNLIRVSLPKEADIVENALNIFLRHLGKAPRVLPEHAQTDESLLERLQIAHDIVLGGFSPADTESQQVLTKAYSDAFVRIVEMYGRIAPPLS